MRSFIRECKVLEEARQMFPVSRGDFRHWPHFYDRDAAQKAGWRTGVWPSAYELERVHVFEGPEPREPA